MHLVVTYTAYNIYIFHGTVHVAQLKFQVLPETQIFPSWEWFTLKFYYSRVMIAFNFKFEI